MIDKLSRATGNGCVAHGNHGSGRTAKLLLRLYSSRHEDVPTLRLACEKQSVPGHRRQRTLSTGRLWTWPRFSDADPTVR